jgi:hypothetical protein
MENTQTAIVSLKLNPCKVSKRGKGAKGTRDVATFGVPVLVDGVAKGFDYEFSRSLPFVALVDNAMSLVPHINRNIAFLAGVDKLILSPEVATESMLSILADELLAMDLVVSLSDGKKLAKYYLDAIANAEFAGHEVTLEILIEQRKAFVAKKKAANDWVSFVAPVSNESISTDMAPRLVKK